MELIFVILLMALLYGLPEMLKSRQPKEYKYPDIPELHQKPQLEIKHMPKIPAAISSAAGKSLKKEKVVMPPAVEVPDFTVEKRPANSAWAAGIIMAEVLQPPRAKRPLFYHKKI